MYTVSDKLISFNKFYKLKFTDIITTLTVAQKKNKLNHLSINLDNKNYLILVYLRYHIFKDDKENVFGKFGKKIKL